MGGIGRDGELLLQQRGVMSSLDEVACIEHRRDVCGRMWRCGTMWSSVYSGHARLLIRCGAVRP